VWIVLYRNLQRSNHKHLCWSVQSVAVCERLWSSVVVCAVSGRGFWKLTSRAERQRGREAERQRGRGREAEKQRSREAERLRSREAEKQRGREAEKQR
jgi:hypothetical protein